VRTQPGSPHGAKGLQVALVSFSTCQREKRLSRGGQGMAKGVCAGDLQGWEGKMDRGGRPLRDGGEYFEKEESPKKKSAGKARGSQT